MRRLDADSGGQWSVQFATEARRLMPTLPLHLDTYYGSAAASPGINLGPYKQQGFRLTLQSYWGDGVWDDPPTRMVQWTATAAPPWPRAYVKPLHRVVPNSASKLPDWKVVFADHRASGCKGVGWYYIDGADYDLLRYLTREAIRTGCAY